MRNNRGKREEEYYYNNNNNGGEIEGYGEGYVEFPCKKHPSSSSTTRGGICAFCLTDRLYQLVCPQCGEQRSGFSSSCSCTTSAASDADLFSSNNPNSASSADVGNVGRISFLLENDNVFNNYAADVMSGKPKIEPRLSSANVDDFATLRRSNSICVGVDRKEPKDNKFWKIGRLFRKKKEKSYNNINNNNNYEENINININNNNNNYECNNNGVTRSRSVSSFRGFYDTEETGNFPVSTSSAARASSVSTGNFYPDSAKMSCFSESEARFSNFDYLDVNGLNKNNNYNYNNSNNNNNNIYSVKESEFTSCDDPAYIDLKLDGMTSSSDHHNSKRVPDLATMRRSRLGMSTKEFGYRGGNHEHDMFVRSGSCRRSSVTERELRNCRKSSKVWKWFFKHQSSSSANRDDPHHEFNNSFDQS
ncbi:uncharacterized protein LOC141644356 [Silene latifolia]|uniref:uncharacterized protein LOC141644356 n=1 Tax=Silene latifolia TaxID=37657 RepID=UPI003D775092